MRNGCQGGTSLFSLLQTADRQPPSASFMPPPPPGCSYTVTNGGVLEGTPYPDTTGLSLRSPFALGPPPGCQPSEAPPAWSSPLPSCFLLPLALIGIPRTPFDFQIHPHFSFPGTETDPEVKVISTLFNPIARGPPVHTSTASKATYVKYAKPRNNQCAEESCVAICYAFQISQINNADELIVRLV